jgi:hypothetical protein
VANVVESPPLPAPAVSLLASAYTPDWADPRLGELGELPLTGGGFRIFDPCDPTLLVDSGYGSRSAGLLYTPFGVDVADSCSTMGMGTAEVAGRARRRMDLVESAAIARELWTGDLAALPAGGSPTDPNVYNPHPSFQRSVAAVGARNLTPAAGPVSPNVGAAILEDALAGLLDGPTGMIHCTRGILGLLGFGVRREGNLHLTRSDTRVVADAGYPGTGPAGTVAAGESWMYATAPVSVRRSAVTAADGVERAVNTAFGWAQLLAAVAFDGPAFGVRVTIT